MSDDIVTRLRDAGWNQPTTNLRLCIEAAEQLELVTLRCELWKKAALAYQSHLEKHGCDWTTTFASQPFYEAVRHAG